MNIKKKNSFSKPLATFAIYCTSNGRGKNNTRGEWKIEVLESRNRGVVRQRILSYKD